jgi:hypothetical protein
MSDKLLDDLDPSIAFVLWGYDLRGDVLEVGASIAEGFGDTIDMNSTPLWDHPEWLEGWFRDGQPYTPPLHHALPYVPGSPWAEITFHQSDTESP